MKYARFSASLFKVIIDAPMQKTRQVTSLKMTYKKVMYLLYKKGTLMIRKCKVYCYLHYLMPTATKKGR